VSGYNGEMSHLKSFAHFRATHRTSLLLGLALASPLSALAQTPPAELEPVQVTASRLPDPPPVSMTILDEPNIEVQHAGDVIDLLRVTPGISVTQPGGPGGISEVFLRSAESNFTVVLIDGVRVNDPSNPRGGGYDFSTLNASEIERIEVARGALSAVHGSDAMAGVINIVTKRPQHDAAGISTHVEAGTDSFQRASAMLSGPVSENMAGSVKGSYTDFGDAVTGTTQRIASLQADLDYGESNTGLGNVRSGVRHVERDRKSFPDASGGPKYAVLRDGERSEARETSVWAHGTRAFNSSWSMDTTAAYFRRREETITPPIVPGVFEGVPGSISTSRFQRAQVTMAHRYEFDPRLELGAGIDMQLEDGERDGSLDLGFAQLPSNFDLDRFTRAVYAEARVRIDPGIELYGAARLDDSDDDRSRGSGRVALRYNHASTGTSIQAGWSNGHKQPSFYSLGDTLVGNPDLEVETSETFEVGIEQAFAQRAIVASLTAFNTDYEDLIDFDFATFRLVNRSRVQIDGFEAAISWQATPTLSARAHATVTDIDLGDNAAELLYRPEEYGGIQTTWRWQDRWSAHAQLQYVGERAGSSVPTGDRTLGSYHRVDVAVTHDFNDRLTLFGAVDNLLDKDYQEALGFPDAGVQVRFGATMSF
jgi:outer membrane cobalamin receptor